MQLGNDPGFSERSVVVSKHVNGRRSRTELTNVCEGNSVSEPVDVCSQARRRSWTKFGGSRDQ
jgi:hypothetical protein